MANIQVDLLAPVSTSEANAYTSSASNSSVVCMAKYKSEVHSKEVVHCNSFFAPNREHSIGMTYLETLGD